MAIIRLLNNLPKVNRAKIHQNDFLTIIHDNSSEYLLQRLIRTLPKEMTYRERRHPLALLDACQDESSHIVDYLFNDWVFREIMTYLDVDEPTTLKLRFRLSSKINTVVECCNCVEEL